MYKNDFVASSDITKIATARYVRRNFVDALIGSDNSFINTWGGELYRNNKSFAINKNKGLNRGVQIRYGKNMKEITWDIDINHLDNLSENTLINKTENDIQVNVFATITYGTLSSEEIKYQVLIEANTTNSDFEGYYSDIEDISGNALKLALRELITTTHTHKTSYKELKEVLQKADEDPNNSNNMILFYTGTSVTKTADMDVWNREHVWAQSLSWFYEKESEYAYSDAHHIRPCIENVNSSRGNKKFGESDTYFYPYGQLTTSSKVYELEDNRGDVARIIFYLMTRYSESDRYGFTSIAESLEILLKWNKEDPVSQLEINRNEYIESVQGNRNPFIDYPEFAEEIWG